MAKVKVDAKRAFKIFSGAARRSIKLNQKTLQKLLQDEIITSIKKGKSPVRGEGRYEKYSVSYRLQITGDAFYWKTKNGKVARIVKDENTVDDPDILSFLRSQSLKKRFGKKLSPVNLTLSGNMLRSIFTRTTDKGFEIGFSSKLAFYHQNGEGNLPVRKLLPGPTDRGFNIIIERKVTALIIKNFNKAIRSRTRQSRR